MVQPKINIHANMMPPIPNPIRQGRSLLREWRNSLSTASLQDQMRSREGMTLIRNMSISMSELYDFFWILQRRNMPSPDTKKTASAMIAIYRGTFSPSGLRYMTYPVRRLIDIMVIPIRFFCFCLRSSILMYLWFEVDMILYTMIK